MLFYLFLHQIDLMNVMNSAKQWISTDWLSFFHRFWWFVSTKLFILRKVKSGLSCLDKALCFDVMDFCPFTIQIQNIVLSSKGKHYLEVGHYFASLFQRCTYHKAKCPSQDLHSYTNRAQPIHVNEVQNEQLLHKQP